MTVSMRPTVVCDGCGRSWPGREGENVFDLRFDLLKHDWSNDDKKDFCPTCSAARRHPAGGGT